MLLDENFQSAPSGTHIPSDGSGIGGVNPSSYLSLVLPSNAILLSIAATPKAGAYPAAMTYFQRPVLAEEGNLALDFDLTTDGNAPAQANVIETDTMLVTPGGVRRNFSAQLNYALGGQFEIVMAGQWVAVTQAKPGLILKPGVKHHLTFAYSFTPNAGAVESITLDGATFLVPATMQKADVAQTNWTPYATMQAQQGLLPTATGFAMMLESMTYTWS